MIRAFLISFVMGLLMISIAHNFYQMRVSISHCEQMIQEIHHHADNLQNL